LKCICFIATAAVLQIAVARSEQRAAATDDFLWKKLDARVNETVEKFEGEMGVAIVDLTDGRAILKNPDHVFPNASSIKIAILLELYHQEQEARGGAQGKAKLDDVYIFDPKDLFEDSQIMAGLTAGVTRVTNRSRAVHDRGQRQHSDECSDRSRGQRQRERDAAKFWPNENNVAAKNDGHSGEAR
jgi:beta-lactamase class A